MDVAHEEGVHRPGEAVADGRVEVVGNGVAHASVEPHDGLALTAGGVLGKGHHLPGQALPRPVRIDGQGVDDGNLTVLGGKLGYTLLAVIWGLALFGMILKACWITCPKWFSSVIYIAMGWACVAVFGPLLQVLPTAAFLWLLAGGIIYTIGGVIYALKLPLFNEKHEFFGSHEIFHLFVIAGSFCHFIFMYCYVA